MINHASPIKVHVHEHTGTIILNRPDKRNALTRSMLAELTQAFDDLRCERRIRAVVLSGAGKAFCAGMDLNEMQATAQDPNAESLWYEDAEAYHQLVAGYAPIAQADHRHHWRSGLGRRRRTGAGMRRGVGLSRSQFRAA